MSDNRDSLRNWEKTALVAAAIIVLSPGLYLLTDHQKSSRASAPSPQFVGSDQCRKCHESAYDKWQGSHHDLAMDVANQTTVLGDFADVRFTDPHTKKTSRFFQKDSKYFVETEGPDGRLGTFELTHVFGVEPLQQYLAPFPDGRLQCLNIAWDVQKKRWYRLPPYDVEGPQDWLHWTRGAQTWNAMCAECHSTRVNKGYDPETGIYKTSWSEIHVGCESCHGPGSTHVDWADRPALGRSKEGRMGLAVPTRGLDTTQQIKLCAPCHSRRFQLGDNPHGPGDLLDLMVPQLLTEDLYYPDGQIRGEVYVYGSFVQSKMYRHGVRCSDCHDMHSLKLHKEGNALCTQCHQAETYDTEAHHFHKKVHKGHPSDGSLCIKCHMPETTYMGVDDRTDHSLRVPRPDLSVSLGVPNACSTAGCHGDKPVSWSVKHYTRWYGETRKPHFGTVLAAAWRGDPKAEEGLIRLAGDSLVPAIVQATAVDLLRGYPGAAGEAAVQRALDDEDALVRYTAVRVFERYGFDMRVKYLAPKLYDPVKAVRTTAAMELNVQGGRGVPEEDRDAFQKVLEDYRQSMAYNADLPAQRYNLGNLAAQQGNAPEAVKAYQKAIAIDDNFYPAKMNLARIYNGQGQNEEAEKLLREVVAQEPDLHEAFYSLGLLLAEMKKYEESERYLAQAVSGMPTYGRVRYNHGQVLLVLNRPREAEQELTKALVLEPDNPQFFNALVHHYLGTGQATRAKDLARETLRQFPNHVGALDVLGEKSP